MFRKFGKNSKTLKQLLNIKNYLPKYFKKNLSLLKCFEFLKLLKPFHTQYKN